MLEKANKAIAIESSKMKVLDVIVAHVLANKEEIDNLAK